MSNEKEEASEVTRLIILSRAGDPTATERLYPIVERELRRLARVRLRELRRHLNQRGLEPTKETTQLVNDAFLSLVGGRASFANRAHFVAVAAFRMRSLCRDAARRALAAKRSGNRGRVSLEEAIGVAVAPALEPIDLLALDQALERLGQLDPRQARVVELRFFGGLHDHEVAELLELSEATVKREWRSARAWLQRFLSPPAVVPDPGDEPREGVSAR